MPKNRVKLLLNLLVVAMQTIPRGGTLTIESAGPAETASFKISARGLNSRVPRTLAALLAGCPPTGTVDAHAIQPFYTGLLARSCGLLLSVEEEADAVVVAARLPIKAESSSPRAAKASRADFALVPAPDVQIGRRGKRPVVAASRSSETDVFSVLCAEAIGPAAEARESTLSGCN